jgi:peptide/nickel transport system substrate-binding protein
MDNRFGARDLIISLLLVGVIVAIALHMKQVERQWDKLQVLDQKLTEQTRSNSQTQRELGEVAAALDNLSENEQTEALTREVRQLRQVLSNLNEDGATGEAISEAIKNNAPAATQPSQAEQEAAQAARDLMEVDPFADLKTVKQNADYAPGDWLVRSFASMPERLTPLVSGDVYSSLIHQRVLETLAQRDPETLEWQPLISRSWQIKKNIEPWRAYVDKRMKQPLTEEEIRNEKTFPSEGSDQAKQKYITQRKEQGRTLERISDEENCPIPVTIEFEIRRGVNFSDGEPLTAEDVVFTYNWLMNPDVNAPRQRSYFRKVKSAEKLSRYRVAFHFREPYFLAFSLVGAQLQILPEHFYSQFSATEFNRHPGLLMGSGPYRLEDPTGWRPTPGEPIKLVRNNRYWGEPPAFDRLVRKVLEKDAARLTTFINGDLDTFGPTPKQYEELLKNETVMKESEAFEFYAPSDGFSFIGWNQQRNGEKTLFADKRVRQAMTMLINRKRVIQQILLGHGKVITGPFTPSTEQYDNSIEPWPYAPQRARELLAEAGFEDRNGDGVLESASGKSFEFDFIVPSQSDVSDRISSFVKDALARAGIVVNIKKLEWSVMIQRMDNRNFEAITLSWGGSDRLETDPYQIFHSSQIEGTGDNFVSYANPELDRAIERARRTIDEDKRMKIWHKAHQILRDDQPYTFLFGRQSLGFFDKRIKNVHRTRLGLTDPFMWYVPGQLQKWGH